MKAEIQEISVNEKNQDFNMTSEVQEFYRDKSVFLTGGSGFLGKGTSLTKVFDKKNINK